MIDWADRLEQTLRRNNDPDSHVEQDTTTFHPSQISKCERQCVISKFGLEEFGVNTLWNFQLGNMVHEFMQQQVGGDVPHLDYEYPVRSTHQTGSFSDIDEVTFTGHCDVYDRKENVIYDFKSTADLRWQYDLYDEMHRNQITVYMDALDAQYGQIVYLLKSGPMDDSIPIVKTWPTDVEVYEYDPGVMEALVDKADTIAETLELVGIPETVDEVPFDRCDCWLCEAKEEHNAN